MTNINKDLELELAKDIQRGIGFILKLLETSDDKKIAIVISKHDGKKAYLRMELEDKEELYDKILDYFNHRTEEKIPFEKLKEEFRVEDIFLRDVLEELKENGEIYEPIDGTYRIL